MRFVGLLVAAAVLGGVLGWRRRPSARMLLVALVCLVLLEIAAFIGLVTTYVDEHCEDDPECNSIATPAFVVLLAGFPLLVAVVAALVARMVAGRR